MSKRIVKLIPILILIAGIIVAICRYQTSPLYSLADSLPIIALFIACAVLWQAIVTANRNVIICIITALLLIAGLGILYWVYITGAKAGANLAVDAFMAFVPFLCGAIMCLIVIGKRSDIRDEPLDYFGASVERI